MRSLLLLVACIALASRASDAVPLDLTTLSFDAEVAALPQESWAVIEFFASWCGACQHFKPSYEAAADMIAGSGENKHVTVARVDCATENLACQQFSVRSYPTVMLGHPRDYLPTANATQRTIYSGNRDNAQPVVDWVAQHIGRPIVPSTAALSVAIGSGVNGSKKAADEAVKLAPIRQAVDLVDVVTATVKAFRSTVDNPAHMTGLASREALQDFLDLLATAHPVNQCCIGAEKAERALAKAWPASNEKPLELKALSRIRICGNKLGEQPWGSCRGSSPGSRGYPCAMWQLFHSLAANLPKEASPGVLWMTAVKGFMANFFPCGDCAQHFVTMATEHEAVVVQSADEALLWSWRSHNRVNERVRKDEEKGSFEDSLHPKLQWPTPAMCPTCHPPASPADSKEEWNEAEVLKFLRAFYQSEGAFAGSRRGGGRWHMQGHRKTSLERSARYQGRMFSSHSRPIRTVIWAVIMLVAVLLFFVFCSGPSPRPPVKQPRSAGRNGKASSRLF